MGDYRILVVDDDPRQRELLSTYLTLSNYQVIAVENGSQALKCLARETPDLVLMDVIMPGMDWFQTLAEIRRDTRHSVLPVVMLTSLDRQHLVVKGLELGADDYITKPFDKAELLARIKAVLRRAAPRQRPQGLMEGDLTHVTLSDLLQSMELAVKTAEIVLEGMDGEIYLEEGQLVHARQGGFFGQTAIGRLLLLEKGSFRVRFDHVAEGISKTPQALLPVLMKQTAQVDEIKSVLKRIDPDRRPVVLARELKGFGYMESHRRTMPTDLKRLVAAMENDIKSNLNAVLKMLKQGVLQFAAPSGN